MSLISRFLLVPALLCLSSLAAAPQAEARSATRFADAPVEVAPMVDADALRKALATRRTRHLAQLLAYANAGEFPINRASKGPLNIFIDEGGHVCAAANLIKLDGHGALVKKTAALNNYIVLKDVKTGPLMDWMLTSGFTQEEIARIQEPYMPIAQDPTFDEPVLAEPSPHFAAPRLSATDERARVQGVLRGVHKTLRANNEKSLYLATQRLKATPKVAAAFLAAQ